VLRDFVNECFSFLDSSYCIGRCYLGMLIFVFFGLLFWPTWALLSVRYSSACILISPAIFVYYMASEGSLCEWDRGKYSHVLIHIELWTYELWIYGLTIRIGGFVLCPE
jgi:hypothetical protein